MDYEFSIGDKVYQRPGLDGEHHYGTNSMMSSIPPDCAGVVRSVSDKADRVSFWNKKKAQYIVVVEWPNNGSWSYAEYELLPESVYLNHSIEVAPEVEEQFYQELVNG